MAFDVRYKRVEAPPLTVLVQSIRSPSELVVMIGTPGRSEFEGLALAARTLEREPSVTQIVGGLLDDESQSVAKLLSQRLNRRVVVGCAVSFEPPETKAAVIRGILEAFQTEEL